MNRFQVFYFMVEGKVNLESLMPFKEKIEALSNDELSKIYLLNFKNPVAGLLLGLIPSLILSGFALDRFYKGDIGLGLTKVFMWLYIFLGLFPIAFAREMFQSFFITVWFIDILALLIWNILDYFLVWQGIKKDNLFKIVQFLSSKNDENSSSNEQ